LDDHTTRLLHLDHQPLNAKLNAKLNTITSAREDTEYPEIITKSTPQDAFQYMFYSLANAAF